MKVSLRIPTSLSDITLGTYMEYEKIINSDISHEEMLLKKISILCGVPFEYISEIQMADIHEINTVINNTLNNKSYLQRTFKMKGIEYGFIPNFDKISFGEFVDLDTYIADTSNLHKTMSILYRKIIKKTGEFYDIARYTGEEDPNIMLDMPMDIVNGALVFFYSLGKELLKCIPNYLQQELTKTMTSRQLRNLEKNGDGYLAYIHSLKEKFIELDKLLD